MGFQADIERRLDYRVRDWILDISVRIGETDPMVAVEIWTRRDSMTGARYREWELTERGWRVINVLTDKFNPCELQEQVALVVAEQLAKA